ncbi:ankyrin repeat-containing domain protein [Irpex lacteus]|nr:ankyrin repeat-containing domain protein [Irpex lacteus]
MSSPRRSRPSRSGDSVSISLLNAATKADEDAVLQALLSGADINALDALDDAFKILKTFLTHEKISLSMHGVTPLGLAAWLNIPEVVKMLLEECSGLVSVDGMDALGATPLMYAARDGNVAVVQCLLTHGARPDFRDVNHRTSIQHALRHPQVLWLCESSLRRHRARETLSDDNKRNLSQLNPEMDELLANTPHITCHPKLALKPSRADIEDTTNRLVAAIRNTEIQQIHSILFPPASSRPGPYLVNYPDSDGLSPIHHCVSVEKPSITVLDLLYRAGADMSLYSKSGHGSPLHCLARNARASMPFSIQSFVQHLVVDLRAPLTARDSNLETCIHVAAEHGQSLNVLLALLECDSTGAVRELRNARGLTALEVAKPQYRGAFGPNAEPERSVSSASVRTVKPSTTSVQSAATLASLDFQDRLESQLTRSRIAYEPALTELERATLPQSIVDNLRSLLRQSSSDQCPVDMQSVQDLINETESMGEDLLMHMQTRVTEATEDLKELRNKLAALDSFVQDLTVDDQTKQGARLVAIERAWDVVDESRRRTTDSDDSDRTAVSDGNVRETQVSGKPDPSDIQSIIGVDEDPFARISPEGSIYNGLRPVKSMVNLARHSVSVAPTAEQMSPPKPRERKTSSPTRPDKAARTGASKVKAWFKKKFIAEAPSKLPLISEFGEAKAEPVPETVKRVQLKPTELSGSQAKVLCIACADIARIRESIDTAERFISSASRYINQARRMLDMVLQFAAPSEESSELVEFPPITIPSSPRDSQLIFPCPPTNISPKSSVISFSSTLIEGEEDEPRLLRTLLMRKIEHRTDEALAELEKATTWLRIVREVTRPLRRRTATTP